MTAPAQPEEAQIAWREMIDEANRLYRDSLNDIIANTRGAEKIIDLWDYLVSFYIAAEAYLRNERTGSLACYSAKFLALDPKQYLELVCALQTAVEVTNFLGARDDPGKQNWFNFYCSIVSPLYGCASNYIDEWRTKLDWFDATRLSFRLHDEIAPILGLKNESPFVMDWCMHAAVGIATLAVKKRSSPGWSEYVSSFLKQQTAAPSPFSRLGDARSKGLVIKKEEILARLAAGQLSVDQASELLRDCPKLDET